MLLRLLMDSWGTTHSSYAIHVIPHLAVKASSWGRKCPFFNGVQAGNHQKNAFTSPQLLSYGSLILLPLKSTAKTSTESTPSKIYTLWWLWNKHHLAQEPRYRRFFLCFRLLFCWTTNKNHQPQKLENLLSPRIKTVWSLHSGGKPSPVHAALWNVNSSLKKETISFSIGTSEQRWVPGIFSPFCECWAGDSHSH